MPTALACMNDLMFLSKIMEAAKALSVPLKSVKTPEQLIAACRTATEPVVFLDLDDQRLDAVVIASALRKAQPSVSAAIFAFVSHVNEDRIKEAGPELFDEVFSRGQFVRVLPTLLGSQPSGIG